ncbi:uncharacterized protein LOC142339871 [Convolutriloba macropyga]|uniref:uncharacterized protein LOC142339871 n=1 Tax=Convolutriloba macropyga TaxID=536237 RepID=UPI003F51C8FE
MTSSAHLTVNFVVCTTCLLMAAEKSEAVEPDTTNYGSVGRSNWAFIFDEESFPQSENDQKFVPTDFAGVPNLCRVNNQGAFRTVLNWATGHQGLPKDSQSGLRTETQSGKAPLFQTDERSRGLRRPGGQSEIFGGDDCECDDAVRLLLLMLIFILGN